MTQPREAGPLEGRGSVGNVNILRNLKNPNLENPNLENLEKDMPLHTSDEDESESEDDDEDIFEPGYKPTIRIPRPSQRFNRMYITSDC